MYVQGDVLVEWHGWADFPAGIEDYTVSAYLLVPVSGGGLEDTGVPTLSITVDPTATQAQIQLPQAGQSPTYITYLLNF